MQLLSIDERMYLKMIKLEIDQENYYTTSI